MVILGLGVGVNGEIIDIYFYFVIGVVYLVSLVILGVGGIYYVVFGFEKFDEKGFGY